MPLVTLAGSRAGFAMSGMAALALAAHAATGVRIGNEIKQTVGVVTQLDNADVACHLTLRDDEGKEFMELGDFAICFQKPSIIGKRVGLKYRMAEVLADECQGDPACKKSRRVALVTDARILDDMAPRAAAVAATPPAEGQASFCTPLEHAVFACRTGTKLVSVCASSNASRTRGYLQYRFGRPDSRDPLELMLPIYRPLPSQSASGQSVAFSGGGGAWLRFSKAPFTYVVYTGIGKWGPTGEVVEKQGIVVERGGKVLTHLKCSGKPISLLGPGWFEKTGIRSNGEAFDFPD